MLNGLLIDVGLNIGLNVGLIVGLIFGLYFGINVADIETRTAPNQGILQSEKNAVIVGLSACLVGGLIVGLIDELIDGLYFGILWGILGGLAFGGFAVIQHFALRFVLYREGLLPWKLVPFLDYATERIFLRKVGGGYVFVHRMLMDYFASLEPGPVDR